MPAAWLQTIVDVRVQADRSQSRSYRFKRNGIWSPCLRCVAFGVLAADSFNGLLSAGLPCLWVVLRLFNEACGESRARLRSRLLVQRGEMMLNGSQSDT